MTAVTASAGRRLAAECSPPPRAGSPSRPARGLQRMIEADTWCPDVVVQVASATRALQEVAAGLLNDHLRHCVASAARHSDADGEAALAEVAGTIRQVIRL